MVLSLPTKLLMFIVITNVILGVIDFAVRAENPESAYFNFNSSMASRFTSNGTLDSSSNMTFSTVKLVVADSVSTDTGVTYTDDIKTINSGLDKYDKNYGLVSSMLLGPGIFLRTLDFPKIVYLPFIIIWNVVALMALILLVLGKGG